MFLFTLGFLMFMAGFALIFVGKFHFGQLKISGTAARWAGAFFLLFFPLYFGFSAFVQNYDSEAKAKALREGESHLMIQLDEHKRIFAWVGILLCLGSGGFILIRSARNAAPKRKVASAPQVNAPLFSDNAGDSAAQTPSAVQEEQLTWIPPSQKSRPPRKGRQRNPFDFS